MDRSILLDMTVILTTNIRDCDPVIEVEQNFNGDELRVISTSINANLSIALVSSFGNSL